MPAKKRLHCSNNSIKIAITGQNCYVTLSLCTRIHCHCVEQQAIEGVVTESLVTVGLVALKLGKDKSDNNSEKVEDIKGEL